MATSDDAQSLVSTKRFPDGFLFGAATGAFQVEGGWDEDKPPTIWDEYFHSNRANKSFRYYLDMPEHVFEEFRRKDVEPRLVDMYKGMAIYEVPSSAVDDGARFDFNGDVAADTYHKTDTDVRLLKELGATVYRFSIAPCRIIPNAHDHLPGLAGIEYYNRLIDRLIENGITPVVTLYHYDMASFYHILGGLTNYASYPFYENYVRICFENFGDRVKHWIGSSDVWLAAEGYSSEHFAPGFQEQMFSGYSDYKVLHHCSIVLATAYKMYNEEFKEKQQGQFGFAMDATWFYPEDPNNPEHQKCAELARTATFGVYLDVFSTGKYSDEFMETVRVTNKREGIRIERVQQFTAEEQQLLKGAFDFITFNYYTSVKVRPMTPEELVKEPNLKRRDRGYFIVVDDIKPAEVYEGFFKSLKWVSDKMNNPKILIGENGFPEEEGIDDSEKKIAYHNGILNKLLEAIDDGVDVFGYCVWSFIDSLEFAFGYWKKFGIYAVDFNDESRPRSKKNSFQYFQRLFETKQLQIEN